MWCLEQRNQRRSLLSQSGVVAEILLRQLLEAEFVRRGKFPCQIKFYRGAQGRGLCHQNIGRRLVKFEQDIGGFGLEAFARFQLNLGGTFGLRQDASCLEFASVFKQCVHASNCHTAGLVSQR